MVFLRGLKKKKCPGSKLCKFVRPMGLYCLFVQNLDWDDRIECRTITKKMKSTFRLWYLKLTAYKWIPRVVNPSTVTIIKKLTISYDTIHCTSCLPVTYFL